MKALVSHGPAQRELVAGPTIEKPTDAIIARIGGSTICGTGIVVATGSAVTTLAEGDRVLVSCLSSRGDWILGHTSDGIQEELVRIPFADSSLFKVPEQLSDEQVLFLADILPTANEVGVLNGNVTPGDTVAIVGAGPIGLAAILAAKLYTPGRIVAIDLEPARLTRAARFGADTTIDSGREDAVARMLELTDGLGADVAIEAVGVPATFELCTELVRPGGRIANIGVSRCVLLPTLPSPRPS
jgi:alcohol dehydrogenase